jgi:hypothetical protein
LVLFGSLRRLKSDRFPPRAFEVAVNLNNLAEVLRVSGKGEKAEAFFVGR